MIRMLRLVNLLLLMPMLGYVWFFPVVKAKSRQLVNSFGRIYIPGTTKKYVRGKHGGIDISWTRGSVVRMPRDAVIIFKGVMAGYEALGKQVLARYKRQDGSYRYIRQCHLDSISIYVRAGRVRKRGDTVGRLGSTGQTSGPHDHFELSRSSNWSNADALLNPHEPLEEARKAA